MGLAGPVRTDEQPRRPSLPVRLLVVAAWVCSVPLLLLAGGLATLAVWPQLQRSTLLALAASFAGYGVLAATVVGLLLLAVVLAGRRRRAALVGLVLAVALALAPVSPQLTALVAPPETEGPRLTVVALNLLHGRAEPAALVRAARGADVLALTEVTPQSLQTLLGTELGRGFPHRVGDGAEGSIGTVVLSRHPLEEVAALRLTFEQRLVRVDVPDLGPVAVLAAHPVHPLVAGSARWEQEHRRLVELTALAGGAPVVVAGDLNAVDQHLVMHAWREAGYSDAAHTAAAGWVRIWPADRSHPALIGIDHVLSDASLRATGLRVFDAPGSDHHGLRVELAATRGASR